MYIRLEIENSNSISPMNDLHREIEINWFLRRRFEVEINFPRDLPPLRDREIVFTLRRRFNIEISLSRVREFDFYFSQLFYLWWELKISISNSRRYLPTRRFKIYTRRELGNFSLIDWEFKLLISPRDLSIWRRLGIRFLNFYFSDRSISDES